MVERSTVRGGRLVAAWAIAATLAAGPAAAQLRVSKAWVRIGDDTETIAQSSLWTPKDLKIVGTPTAMLVVVKDADCNPNLANNWIELPDPVRLKVRENKPDADKGKGADPAKTEAKTDEPSYVASGGFGKKPVPRSPLQIRWTFKHLVDGVEKEVSVQTGS